MKDSRSKSILRKCRIPLLVLAILCLAFVLCCVWRYVRLNQYGFDIEGTIVMDGNGEPIHGTVEMLVSYSRPKDSLFPFIGGGTGGEIQKVGPTFHVRKRFCSELQLKFPKTETLSFSLENTDGKELVLHGIEARMKPWPLLPNDMWEHTGNLDCSIADGAGTVLDLSAIPAGDFGKTETKKLPPDAPRTETRYIEFDFGRDENGNIIYGGEADTYRELPCPAQFVLRFHSDDPDDGFVPIDEPLPQVTKWVDPLEAQRVTFWCRRYSFAPETGYRKEIVIPMVRRTYQPWMPETPFPNTFVYLHCGDYFGKAVFHPVRIELDGDEKSVSGAKTAFWIRFNIRPGNTKLRSPGWITTDKLTEEE